MDVKLPDGTIVKNVPENISQGELMATLSKNGIAPKGDGANGNLASPDHFPAGDSRNSPAAVTVARRPDPQAPAAPQSMADRIRGFAEGAKSFGSALDVGKDDLPASIIGLVPRATDAVGLTKGAYPTFHDSVENMNRTMHPSAYDDSTAARVGRLAGNVLVTLPLAGIKAFQGAGIAADAANAALGGAAASVGTSQASDDPLWQQAATGAAGGAVLGGTISTVARGAAKLIGPAMPAEDQALSYVQRVMKGSPNARDATSLRSIHSVAHGKPITSAEAIGKPGEVAIGALARRPGATGSTMAAEMAARDAGAPDRILSDYSAASSIDPAAAKGDLQAFVDSRKAAAAPLYDEAYRANSNISSRELDRILATPAGQRALATARETMQNDQTLMGTPDAEIADQAREAGQAVPKGGLASGLKLRTYDYVKRALDDQITTAQRSGTPNAASALIGLKGRLVKALDAADVTAQAGPNSLKPAGGAYAQARATAGDYLGAQHQFENGQKFILNPSISADDLADHIGSLGKAEADAFKGGVANRLFMAAQNSRLGPNIFNAPSIRQKLASVLGEDGATQFLQRVQQEQQMAAFAKSRVPRTNSAADYAAEMAVQDGEKVDYAKAVGMAAHGVMAPHSLPVMATSAAIDRIARLAARNATGGMSEGARDAAGRMLLMPPAELAKVLDSAKPTGYVGGRVPSYAERVAAGIRRNVQHVSRGAGVVAPSAIAAIGLK